MLLQLCLYKVAFSINFLFRFRRKWTWSSGLVVGNPCRTLTRRHSSQTSQKLIFLSCHDSLNLRCSRHWWTTRSSPTGASTTRIYVCLIYASGSSGDNILVFCIVLLILILILKMGLGICSLCIPRLWQLYYNIHQQLLLVTDLHNI